MLIYIVQNIKNGKNYAIGIENICRYILLKTYKNDENNAGRC